MKIFFIGDIFARSGRILLSNHLSDIKKTYGWDICIANAENAAGGKGINYNLACHISYSGLDVLTMGNHIWARKEIPDFIEP